MQSRIQDFALEGDEIYTYHTNILIEEFSTSSTSPITKKKTGVYWNTRWNEPSLNTVVHKAGNTLAQRTALRQPMHGMLRKCGHACKLCSVVRSASVRCATRSISCRFIKARQHSVHLDWCVIYLSVRNNIHS